MKARCNIALIIGAATSANAYLRQASTMTAPVERDFGAYKLMLFNDRVSTFDEAEAICNENSATLARISSVTEMDELAELVNGERLIDETEGRVWVGIEAERNVAYEDPFNTARFKFTDGDQTNVDFVRVERSTCPWYHSEPNDDGHDEDCVEFIHHTSLLNDRECFAKRSFVCRTQSPFEDSYKQDGQEYILVNKPMAFDEADGYCRMHNSRLARHTNTEDLEFFSEWWNSEVETSNSFWTAAHSREGRDYFSFTDGYPGLHNWLQGNEATSPWYDSPTGLESRRCVEVWTDVARFLDVSCNIEIGFFCKRSIEPRVPDVRRQLHQDMFLLFNESSANFETADTHCIENGGRLARVANEEEFAFVTSLIVDNLPLRADVWIGIDARDVDEFSSHDTCRFSYTDGHEDDLSFIHAPAGACPYAGDEPNNYGGQNERCMQVRNYGAESFFNDAQCGGSFHFICRLTAASSDSCGAPVPAAPAFENGQRCAPVEPAVCE